MFAHNNIEIDYFKLAVVNALLIQKNLNLPKESITVVTDQDSYDYSAKLIGKDLVESAIGNIIFEDKDIQFKSKNVRLYKDTSQSTKYLSFYNKNRCDAYDISPYDETIIIDVDYLILSDALNHCWGHNNELMISKTYHDVNHQRVFGELRSLSDYGIDMYWATVVYFRKSPNAENFFNYVKHVRDHRDYYQMLYNWQGALYRNDYSFSIAAHVMGGFSNTGVSELPVKLYKTFDNDDIYEVTEDLDILFYLEKIRSPGDYTITRWKNVDVHVMNKWALNRVGDKFLEAMNAA